MQITSILNVLASTPATMASSAAMPGAAALTGQIPGAPGVPGAAPSLADALIPQNAAVQGQFAQLLAGENVKVAALPLAPVSTDVKALKTDTKDLANDLLATDSTNTPGDVAAINPQTSGSIAVPPIGLYIDQPAKPVVLTADAGKNAVEDATSGSGKKLIFEEADKLVAEAKGKATGSEAAEQAALDKTEGNIKLAGLVNSDGKQVAQDPEFAKAFANILHKGKDKTTVKQEIQSKVVEVKSDIINDKTAVTEKAAAATALTQPQQVASKISAKILGIKEDKIASIDSTSVDGAQDLTNKLMDLDTQLRTKSYIQIKAASATLAQTPAEQVQFKISQALETGINTIKINLHPMELGSVDVDMDVDKEGNTNIRIVADKSETLQLLKNDSNHLVKSLSEIGVKADASNLQFSLRGDSQQQQFADAQNGNNNNGQQNSQQVASVTGNYSRYSRLNEQDLILSINNKSLNILV